MVWPMLRRRGKVGLKTEINGVANDDGNQVFDPAFCSGAHDSHEMGQV